MMFMPVPHCGLASGVCEAGEVRKDRVKSEEILSRRNLRQVQGGVMALGNVSAGVAADSITAVIGPNGREKLL